MAEFEKCRDPECPVYKSQARAPRPHCHPLNLPHARARLRALGDVSAPALRPGLNLVGDPRDPAPILRKIAAMARNGLVAREAIATAADQAADIFEEERRPPGIA